MNISEERAESGYPSRKQTLEYYLEDLTAALEELGEKRLRNPMDPDFDKYFYADGHYHYYEVLWANHTVENLLYAIWEVEDKLQKIYWEEHPQYESAQLPGQVCMMDFKYLMCAA